jgi:endonuclease YncB( thermonuclease family)
MRLLMLLLLIFVGLAWYAYHHREVTWRLISREPIVGSARIIDGDTIDIADTRIRLEAIDAPELDQTCEDAQRRRWSCGAVASRELRRHVGGEKVSCEPSGYDRYRRVLAICYLPDESDLNAWMVRQGWAVAFRSTTRYRAEQEEAAAAHRGLWAGKFVLPWEWRQQHPH